MILKIASSQKKISSLKYMVKKTIRKIAKKAYKKIKTETGNRYGRGFNQIISKGVPQMAKDIVMLKNMLNVEKKQKENTYSATVGQVDINNSGAYTVDITPIFSQGITYTTRNGRSIKLTGATLHWQFQEQTAQLVRMKIRIQIVRVIGNPFSGTSPLTEFYDLNPLSTVVDYYSDRNPQNFKQFKVLSTKNITMYPDQMTTTGRCISLKQHLKLSHHIKYGNDGDGLVDGQIYAIVTCENGNRNFATASTLTEIPVLAANTGLQVRLYTRFYAIDN